MSKEAILLKITGKLFLDPTTNQLTRVYADSLATQIKTLQERYTFGIVIGGGAFFRGTEHNHALNLRSAMAHTIGMLATVMSSTMLYDIFYEHGIPCTLLCGFDCSLAGTIVSQPAIDQAYAHQHVIIFGGGTGNPYVSTDTCAVIRAKQMGALQLWKATNVDGVYTADPQQNRSARLLNNVHYHEALDKQLHFMDSTAIVLAQQEKLITRVFNVFSQNAILNAAQDTQWGTIID